MIYFCDLIFISDYIKFITDLLEFQRKGLLLKMDLYEFKC